VDGRSAEASIAFSVDSLISSVAPTNEASYFFSVDFFLIGFLAFLGKIFGIGFFFGFFGLSSSSSSSGAEPLNLAALFSIASASIKPAKADVASLFCKSFNSSVAYLPAAAFSLAAAATSGSIGLLMSSPLF